MNRLNPVLFPAGGPAYDRSDPGRGAPALVNHLLRELGLGEDYGDGPHGQHGTARVEQALRDGGYQLRRRERPWRPGADEYAGLLVHRADQVAPAAPGPPGATAPDHAELALSDLRLLPALPGGPQR